MQHTVSTAANVWCKDKRFLVLGALPLYVSAQSMFVYIQMFLCWVGWVALVRVKDKTGLLPAICIVCVQ